MRPTRISHAWTRRPSRSPARWSSSRSPLSRREMAASSGWTGRRPASRFPSRGNSHERQTVEPPDRRSEEHTSELQSRSDLVCRLLLEKKKKKEQKESHRKISLHRQKSTRA